MTALKPCPWCGADALLEHLRDHDNSGYAMVSCSARCHCDPYLHASTEDDAVTRWNRRDGAGTECPFCGSQVRLVGPPDFELYTARCSNKPYSTCVVTYAVGEDADEALALWAQRVYAESP